MLGKKITVNQISEMEIKFLVMMQEVKDVLHRNSNYELLEEIIKESRKDIDALLEEDSEKNSDLV